MKFEPERVRTCSCPPEKPPRETSYDDVASDVITLASRGKAASPKLRPLS